MDRHAVSLCWSPGHMGILGNDLADSLAQYLASPTVTPLDPESPDDQRHNRQPVASAPSPDNISGRAGRIGG